MFKWTELLPSAWVKIGNPPKPRHELCSRLLQSCYGSIDWIWFGYDLDMIWIWFEYDLDMIWIRLVYFQQVLSADGNRWQPMATAWSKCRLVELDSWQGLLAWRRSARIPPFFRKEFFVFQEAPHVLSRSKISKHHQYNSVQLGTTRYNLVLSVSESPAQMHHQLHHLCLGHHICRNSFTPLFFALCHSLPLSATWTWN